MAKKVLLFAFFMVIGALGLFAIIFQKIPPQPDLNKENLPPLEVRLSNFCPDSLTVSWLTEEKTSGAVIYSDQRKKIENSPQASQLAEDFRGPMITPRIHFVTLKNLQPGRKYYLAIKSGNDYYFQKLDGSWGKEGFALEQNTPPLIGFDPGQAFSPQNSPGSYSSEKAAWNPCYDSEGKKLADPCFRPNFLQGKTLNPEGQAIGQALVFAQIPGRSSLLSFLTDKEGRWSFDLARFFNQELSGYLAYNPEVDLVRLTARDDSGQTFSGYQEVPKVNPFPCPDPSLTDCQELQPGSSQPIFLILSPGPESSPSPTLSPAPRKKAPEENLSGFNNFVNLSFI